MVPGCWALGHTYLSYLVSRWLCKSLTITPSHDRQLCCLHVTQPVLWGHSCPAPESLQSLKAPTMCSIQSSPPPPLHFPGSTRNHFFRELGPPRSGSLIPSITPAWPCTGIPGAESFEGQAANSENGGKKPKGILASKIDPATNRRQEAVTGCEGLLENAGGGQAWTVLQ